MCCNLGHLGHVEFNGARSDEADPVSRYSGKLFVLHSGREQSGDAAGVENSSVLATATSETQARELGYWFRDAIWWEYEVVEGRIVGGFPRWDLWVRRGPENLRKAK